MSAKITCYDGVFNVDYWQTRHITPSKYDLETDFSEDELCAKYIEKHQNRNCLLSDLSVMVNTIFLYKAN